MIDPTLGATVLVHLNAASKQAGGTPWPATIQEVATQRLLRVSGNDQPFGQVYVPLLQDDDEPPETGPFAEWPPEAIAAADSASA